MNKLCTKCNVVKTCNGFHKSKATADGLQSQCKECRKIAFQKYKTNNEERRKILQRKWNQTNQERRREQARRYKANNLDLVHEREKRYRENNPGKVLARINKRRADLKNRTPAWLTEEQLQEIQQLYIKAQELDLEVDHIVPLNGKYVSGLHVPWNLQLLTKEANRAKRNHFISL